MDIYTILVYHNTLVMIAYICYCYEVFTYPKFMNRITQKDVDFQLERLNKLTNNPTDWRLVNGCHPVGNIHTIGQYGYTTIMQTINDGGGCNSLASGLTKREAYQWLRAAIAGIYLKEDSSNG